MTTLLVTIEELRTWTREAIDAPEDIEFAEAIIDAVSLRISEELDHPLWLEDQTHTGTRGARSVALQVARRTYLNPDQETRTAAIGPIGGTAYLDDFAQALTLTESEQERLTKIKGDSGGSTGNGLYTVRVERDDPIGGPRDIVLQDSYGSGVIYAGEEDAWAFTPEETV